MSRLFEDAVNSVDEVAQQEPEHVDTIEIVCELIHHEPIPFLLVYK